MKTTVSLLETNPNMEDKLDLLIDKLSKIEKEIEKLTETVEAHRVEHGFAKMQDGGINSQFGGGSPQPGMGGGGYQMPGMGGNPMGPGMGGMAGPDPSRPPGF